VLAKGENTVWAWLGGRAPICVTELLAGLADSAPGTRFAVGEPGFGLAGWRLSHRQANAAFAVALRSRAKVVRYGDVCLLAAAVQDEVLWMSLHQLYLLPLATERDDGESFRTTLSAYFGAHRNAASTAARLGVSRQTVSARLRTAEARIGMPLTECAQELELALRMHELESSPGGACIGRTT
jgi:DNA-binding PucR family transcriptional regulator